MCTAPANSEKHIQTATLKNCPQIKLEERSQTLG
jgi:hypothetical protein